MDVGRTAAPLPALLLVVETLFLLVTAAAAQAPLGAGRSDCMGDPSSDDSVGECSLLTACDKEKTFLITIAGNRIHYFRHCQASLHTWHSCLKPNHKIHESSQVQFINQALLQQINFWMNWILQKI